MMRVTTSKNGLTGMPGRRAILIVVMGLGLAFCPLLRADQTCHSGLEAKPRRQRRWLT